MTPREREIWLAGRDAAAAWHEDRALDDLARASQERGITRGAELQQRAHFHHSDAVLIRALQPPPDLTQAEPDAKDAEIARLRAALQEHHDWHLESGIVLQVTDQQNGETVTIDGADAYSDGAMCDRTIAALALAPAPSGEG